MDKSKHGTLLLVLGWGLFISCLLFPALVYNENSIVKGPILGIAAGLAAITSIINFSLKLSWLQFSISGIGNIFATLAIFSIYLSNRKALLYLSVIFIVFFVTSLTFLFRYRLSVLGAGYYLWVTSLLLISYSYIVAYKENA